MKPRGILAGALIMFVCSVLAQPPIPPLPKPRIPAQAAAKPRTAAQSPRAKQLAASLGKPMVVVLPPVWIENPIGATYFPSSIPGLKAFVQVQTNFGVWSAPAIFAYPTNGGLVWGYWKSPTNELMQFRFGYSVP